MKISKQYRKIMDIVKSPEMATKFEKAALKLAKYYVVLDDIINIVEKQRLVSNCNNNDNLVCEIEDIVKDKETEKQATLLVNKVKKCFQETDSIGGGVGGILRRSQHSSVTKNSITANGATAAGSVTVTDLSQGGNVAISFNDGTDVGEFTVTITCASKAPTPAPTDKPTQPINDPVCNAGPITGEFNGGSVEISPSIPYDGNMQIIASIDTGAATDERPDQGDRGAREQGVLRPGPRREGSREHGPERVQRAGGRAAPRQPGCRDHGPGPARRDPGRCRGSGRVRSDHRLATGRGRPAARVPRGGR